MLIKNFFLAFFILVINVTQENHAVSSNKPRVARFIGGTPTFDLGRFGYHVALEAGFRYFCAGVIVSKLNVLTAGHCLTGGLDPSDVVIRSGTSTRELNGDTHQVKNFTIHPSFKLDKHNNSRFDIAVIRVVDDEPFVYSNTTKKIDLFDQGEEAKPGEAGLEVGWGIDETGGFSHDLKYVEVPIVSKADCNKSYAFWGGIQEGQICAGTGNGVGSWHGDSGGGLVVKKRLAGIIAYGEGKDGPEYPGVCSEIGYLRKWVDRYVEYDQPLKKRNICTRIT